jgi:predicted kinase
MLASSTASRYDAMGSPSLGDLSEREVQGHAASANAWVPSALTWMRSKAANPVAMSLRIGQSVGVSASRRRLRRRPLAVLVGGAPGSGKTTLAGELGRRLYLPVLHKDVLRNGLMCTVGRDASRVVGPPGPQIFYETLEVWLRSDVSTVADMTFYPGVSEADVAQFIAPLADMVQVHCRTPRSVARFEQRTREDAWWKARWADDLLPEVTRLQAALQEPVDFGCPSIVVDTTDGYEPTLNEITDAIDGVYPGSLPSLVDPAP